MNIDYNELQERLKEQGRLRRRKEVDKLLIEIADINTSITGKDVPKSEKLAVKPRLDFLISEINRIDPDFFEKIRQDEMK